MEPMEWAAFKTRFRPDALTRLDKMHAKAVSVLVLFL